MYQFRGKRDLGEVIHVMYRLTESQPVRQTGKPRAAKCLFASPLAPNFLYSDGLVPLVPLRRCPGEFLAAWRDSKTRQLPSGDRRIPGPPSSLLPSPLRHRVSSGTYGSSFSRKVHWLVSCWTPFSFVVPSTRRSRLAQIRRSIQVMSASPPYLQAGPVAIHIHSRETNPQPASPPGGHSLAEPTLDVQGLVLLSPDNGASIEELNGIVVSKIMVC